MANTITQTTLSKTRNLVQRHIRIVSDGTEEADLVIYDSSDIAASLGITDPLTSTLMRAEVISYTNASNSAALALEYDATTDVPAVTIQAVPAGTGGRDQSVIDLYRYNGMPNLAGAGKTGDILLTTTLLDNGDIVDLFIEVRPA